VIRFLCAPLLALNLFVISLVGQEAPQPQPPSSQPSPNGEFFSGNVTDLTQDSVTVVRKGLGRDSLTTRKFVLDNGTKIEGHLRTRARVTVRFATAEDGSLRALHIIVR
jgi:hypothetical protein